MIDKEKGFAEKVYYLWCPRLSSLSIRIQFKAIIRNSTHVSSNHFYFVGNTPWLHFCYLFKKVNNPVYLTKK